MMSYGVSGRDWFGAVLGVQGVVDDFCGDSPLPADAPMIASKFNDGRRKHVLRFAGIQDYRNAIAELTKHLLATFTGRRTREIRTGAGERHTNLVNQATDNLVIRPAKGDAAGVGSDLEWQTIGSVNDDGQRSRPAGLGKTIEIIGEFARKNGSVFDGINEDGKCA